MSFKEGISCLVEPKFIAQESNSNSTDSILIVHENGATSSGNVREDKKRYAEFFKALQNLLESLSMKSGGHYNDWRDLQQFPVRDGLYNTIRGLLKESLCILPQDRRTEDEADQWILTLKEAERQLINWKLRCVSFLQKISLTANLTS